MRLDDLIVRPRPCFSAPAGDCSAAENVRLVRVDRDRAADDRDHPRPHVHCRQDRDRRPEDRMIVFLLKYQYIHVDFWLLLWAISRVSSANANRGQVELLRQTSQPPSDQHMLRRPRAGPPAPTSSVRPGPPACRKQIVFGRRAAPPDPEGAAHGQTRSGLASSSDDGDAHGRRSHDVPARRVARRGVPASRTSWSRRPTEAPRPRG